MRKGKIIAHIIAMAVMYTMDNSALSMQNAREKIKRDVILLLRAVFNNRCVKMHTKDDSVIYIMLRARCSTQGKNKVCRNTTTSSI